MVEDAKGLARAYDPANGEKGRLWFNGPPRREPQNPTNDGLGQVRRIAPGARWQAPPNEGVPLV